MVDGIRLIRKAVLMVLVIDCGEFLKLNRRGRMIGVRRVSRISSMDVFRSRVIFTTFTWSCTKMGGS